MFPQIQPRELGGAQDVKFFFCEPKRTKDNHEHTVKQKWTEHERRQTSDCRMGGLKVKQVNSNLLKQNELSGGKVKSTGPGASVAWSQCFTVELNVSFHYTRCSRAV